MTSLRSCDLFCTVVDNYGDIGIAARLARQLVEEHGVQLRLWVDDLRAFSHLEPGIDPGRAIQPWRGMEVRNWSEPAVSPHDLVIEAFACELPEVFLHAMARRAQRPVWLNLDYLSAESWVDGCHGLPSPHPRLPLTKYFFFPGFTRQTGGLLREAGLAKTVRQFQSDAIAQSGLWNSLGVPAVSPGEIRVSLFAYENPAIASLLAGLARQAAPVSCLLPQGKALGPALAALGRAQGGPGDVIETGNLRLHILPFLRQEQYDRLLWACDLNVVRGEDSFVRAQFAGRPLLWQAYVQEGGAHEKKVRAWLDRYLVDAPPALAMPTERAFLAWNRGQPLAADWPEQWLAGKAHAQAWAEHLFELPGLAEELVKFAANRL